MKWILRAGTSLAIIFSLAASADLSQDLLGQWQYDGFKYQNHRYPNPNPKLKLTFTFNADHTARLYYKRDDEVGSCDRLSTWQVHSDSLDQTVTWVNPANQSSCGQDTDMQMGQVTQTRISIHNGELDFFMTMNGSEFIYIMIRIPPQSETPLKMSRAD